MARAAPDESSNRSNLGSLAVSDEMDLFGWRAPEPPPSYPTTPGSKEKGGASEIAAEIAKRRDRSLTIRLVAELKGGSGTADELAARLQENPLSVRPRLSRLYALGKVTKTDIQRPSSMGCPSVVWRLISETTSDRTPAP